MSNLLTASREQRSTSNGRQEPLSVADLASLGIVVPAEKSPYHFVVRSATLDFSTVTVFSAHLDIRHAESLVKAEQQCARSNGNLYAWAIFSADDLACVTVAENFTNQSLKTEPQCWAPSVHARMSSRDRGGCPRRH